MNKEKKLYVELNDYEGCIRLACRIGETRSRAYRAALCRFLREPNEAHLSSVYTQEKRLKGPVTGLDDDDIETIQKQMVRERPGVYRKAVLMMLKDKYRRACREYRSKGNEANLAAMERWEQKLKEARVPHEKIEELRRVH